MLQEVSCTDVLMNITGTPEFLALPLLHSGSVKSQNISTELESLLYVLLFCATAGQLHWKRTMHEDAWAFDMKFTPMGDKTLFKEKIISRVYLHGLHGPVLALRKLFYLNGWRIPSIDAKAFRDCLSSFMS